MHRFLIYVFPAMMDIVVGSVLFVGPVRMAETGASATAVTCVLAAWAITYMFANLLIGHLITTRNAAAMLISSGFCMAACAAAFVIFSSVNALYVLMIFQAIATALFFAPFQVFMKAVEHGQPQGIVRPTACYTFAWSLGLALGSFTAGYVWQIGGWQWCHAINAVLALIISLGVFCLRHHAHQKPAPSDQDPQAPPPLSNGVINYDKLPDLAWLGWIGAAVGCLTLYMICGVFPSTAFEHQIPKHHQGTIIALIGAIRALVALFFIRSRTWMYRALPVGLLSLTGVIGLALFGWGDSIGTYYLAAVAVGVYSACFYFIVVFYSLVHPSRSGRYVSINESIVGSCGFIGPVIGGLLADRFNMSTPYLVGAYAVIAAIILQIIVHRRNAPALQEHLHPQP